MIILFVAPVYVIFRVTVKNVIFCFYVNNYKPLDKAGAYGIQDWIGQVGVEKIEGSYFNVMGFPLNLVYSHLLEF